MTGMYQAKAGNEELRTEKVRTPAPTLRAETLWTLLVEGGALSGNVCRAQEQHAVCSKMSKRSFYGPSHTMIGEKIDTDDSRVHKGARFRVSLKTTRVIFHLYISSTDYFTLPYSSWGYLGSRVAALGPSKGGHTVRLEEGVLLLDTEPRYEVLYLH